MQPVKLKLLPTLVCFGIVGLLAATIPYPGLQSGLSLVTPQQSR